jgi:hypothetical protein
LVFSAEQLERKMERGGKSWERVKEEQRGLFLKEIVKKSKDAEKNRNEINKEEDYKTQYLYLILINFSINKVLLEK